MARQSTLDLKQRFKMALALEDMSVAQWAREYTTIKPAHLHQVLDGRPSMRLTQQIVEWTDKTLKSHKVAA